MTTNQTVWILSGEASGDIYGAHLIKELMQLRSDLKIKAMGGPKIASTGVELMVDSTELGVMGFIEVLKLYKTFKAILNSLYKKLEEERPNAVVLIDYPGFNLRIAKRAHELGIKVIYYISPQIWAWKKKRKWKIAQWVDKLMCIFPFEPKHYADTDLNVEFIGHPLLEVIEEEKDPNLVRDKKTILLLPGSRNNELERLFPVMLETAMELHKEQPDLIFHTALPRESLLARAKELLTSYQQVCPDFVINFSVGDTHQWMQKATAGIAASGTVTVESAMFGLPLVVVYKVSFISFLIYKLLIKGIRFVTMVNIIPDRCIFKEFLQYEMTKENLLPALKEILPDGARRNEVEQGMDEVVCMLGGKNNVSRRAAECVLETIDQ